MAAVLLAVQATAPGAVLPSTSPPGGLSPSATPQMVVLTFDDGVTDESYALVSAALARHRNPNGHPIKATFFVSLDCTYDALAIRRLYADGHEIALHTVSHRTGTDSRLSRWTAEIGLEKRILARTCAIPEEDLVGFRAPGLRANDSALRAVFEQGLRYDSSFPERLGHLSRAPEALLWPYTLDQGLAQACPRERAPRGSYPGLFEIPLWAQLDGRKAVTAMDPPATLSSNEVVALWCKNFLARYEGNRAPYGIFLHTTTPTQWLSNPEHSAWRTGALSAFIAWALVHPDTWFVTCRDVVDYVESPVPAAMAATHAAFSTPWRELFPPNARMNCLFPEAHPFCACGAPDSGVEGFGPRITVH